MMISRNYQLTIFVLLVLTVFSAFLTPVTADSSVTMTSKVCVNGQCSYSGTGYPHYPYYQYPDYWYTPGYPYQNWNNYGYPCSPYRTVNFQGYLNAGQYRTYGFRIGGPRSYIEWILNGGCNSMTPPIMMSSGTSQVYTWRQVQCGAEFDIYVYQNRYPCSSCPADYWDTSHSSNAYVGVVNPCQGCYYSVVIYCRSGSGYYDLTSNSYVNNCWYPYEPSGPVMMSSVQQMMTAGSENILMVADSQYFDSSNMIWAEDDSGTPGMTTGYNAGSWQPPLT